MIRSTTLAILFVVAPLLQYAAHGRTVVLVEAVPDAGVRYQTFAYFTSLAVANSYTVADLVGLTQDQRDTIANYAKASIGKQYDLQWPLPNSKGPKFSCVGLAEAAYESAGVDPTTFSNETDGVWPFFFPDEQFSGMHNKGPLPEASLQIGDIVFRDTKGIDIIPGTWDHVAVVVYVPDPVGNASYGYSSGPEVCCDKVDNNENGFMDQSDGCPQEPCPADAVPSLTQWGLMFLALSFAWVSVRLLRGKPVLPRVRGRVQTQEST